MSLKTRKIDPAVYWQATIDNELHVWFNDDPNFEMGKGWYSCFSGYMDGNYSESDNFGPADTEQEAWEDIKSHYQEWHSN